MWRQRIQYRFQNDRRRKDFNVIARRRLHAKDVDEASPAKKRCMWGLPRYLCERPVGEDDASIKSHMLTMADEKSKRKPDQAKLDRLMEATFADRREFIVKRCPMVKEVLDTYPVLTMENEVSCTVFL